MISPSDSITVHTSPIFQIFFLKKDFSENHGNLVLITTVQVELSKFNFNFDDIRTHFLQVLRDCRQHSSRLMDFVHWAKNAHPLFLTDNIKMDRILTKMFYIAFQVLKVLLIKIYSHLIFYFLLFLFNFTSADIFFHKFLKLYSTLYIWKKDFHHKFSFFNGFTQPPHTPTLLTAKIRLAWQKFDLSRFFKIIMLWWR